MLIIDKDIDKELSSLIKNIKSNSKEYYYALKIKLYNADSDYNNKYHSKVILNIISNIFDGSNTILYLIEHNVILIICKGDYKELVIKAVDQIKFLVYQENKKQYIYRFFDLKLQLNDFFVFYNNHISKLAVNIKKDNNKLKRLQDLSVSNLVKIEKKLELMNFSNIINYDPVYLCKDSNISKIFDRLYINLDSVCDLLDVDINNINDNSHLIRHVFHIINHKVINIINDDIDFYIKNNSSISIRTSISTINSKFFIEFSNRLSYIKNLDLYFEINIYDIMNNMYSFIIANSIISSLGYKIIVIGIDSNTLDILDLDFLSYHFIAISSLDSSNVKKIKEYSNNFILLNCNSPQDLIKGKNHNIIRYQGKYIQELDNNVIDS